MLRTADLHDLPGVHEHHPVTDLTGEAHLVSDDDHGHAGTRQIDHDLKHLADHFRVESTGRFVEQHHLGSHRDAVRRTDQDRKSTRLNSSHVAISYAVFCLKKKKES